MKWILGIIIVYAIYFLVVTVLDLLKEGKTESKDNEEIFSISAEEDEPILVVGEFEKKK